MTTNPADADAGSPYPDGIPSLHRLRFLPLGLVRGARLADFSEVVATVAGLLNRPARFEDDDRYVHEITAAAIHPDHNWFAWVEYICNDQDPRFVDICFYQRAQMDGELAINWKVETYNPYFGCHVGYLRWHGKRLVIIYREKHDTYAAVLCRGGFRHRLPISDQWLVRDEEIVYFDGEEQRVRRLLLPRLLEQRSLSLDEACQAGYIDAQGDETSC